MYAHACTHLQYNNEHTQTLTLTPSPAQTLTLTQHKRTLRPLGEGFTGTLREGKEVTVRVRGEDTNWIANRLGNIGITGR